MESDQGEGHPVIVVYNSLDVPNTAKSQAKIVFEVLGADEVVLPFPYVGMDSVEVFKSYGKPVHIAAIRADPEHFSWFKEAQTGKYLWQVLSTNIDKKNQKGPLVWLIRWLDKINSRFIKSTPL